MFRDVFLRVDTTAPYIPVPLSTESTIPLSILVAFFSWIAKAFSSSSSRDFREELEKSAESQGLDTKELQKEVDDLKKEINEITGTVKRRR